VMEKKSKPAAKQPTELKDKKSLSKPEMVRVVGGCLKCRHKREM